MKKFTAKTSYASFVLMVHEIPIYSKQGEIKKGFLKKTQEKKIRLENRVMEKLM